MTVTALLLLAALATLDGQARVIDGDTLVVSGRHIRLDGIDAPETKQVCQRDGDWRCGLAATEALKARIGTSEVRCKGSTKDRYRRLISTCWAGSVNLNEDMVRSGWAVAYRRYSITYVPAEDEAKGNKAGLWSSEFQMPWEWRRQGH